MVTKTAAQQQQQAAQPNDADPKEMPTNPILGQLQIGNPAYPHVHQERNALSENKSGDIGW